MRLILRYMKQYTGKITVSMVVKLLGSVTELLIPYILEHLIDEVVPLGELDKVLLWGSLMVVRRLPHANSMFGQIKSRWITRIAFLMISDRIYFRVRQIFPARSLTHLVFRASSAA